MTTPPPPWYASVGSFVFIHMNFVFFIYKLRAPAEPESCSITVLSQQRGGRCRGQACLLSVRTATGRRVALLPVSWDARASHPAPAPDCVRPRSPQGVRERLHESNTPFPDASGPWLGCVQKHTCKHATCTITCGKDTSIHAVTDASTPTRAHPAAARLHRPIVRVSLALALALAGSPCGVSHSSDTSCC